jgi:hypothetical protein
VVWQVYTEYKLYGTDGTDSTNYHCGLYDGINNYYEPVYRVCRYAHGTYFRWWAAAWGSTVLASFPTGFYDGYDSAGAENASSAAAPTASDSNRYDWWTVYDDDYCGTPHTLTSAGSYLDPGWTITNPPVSGQFYTYHP